MIVLVTGSAGFVGKHVVAHLEANDHEAICLDRHDPTDRIDLLDLEAGAWPYPKQRRIDAIVHCAAYADLRHNWASIGERDKQWQDNVQATINLLEAMPPVPLIFTSSASVYGSLYAQQTREITGRVEYDADLHRSEYPLHETAANPETIESPYAASKLACEAIIAAYAHYKGFPYYNLRLVNQVGAGSHRGVIADFVRMAKAEGKIHAADDGSQKKSWVHVDDTAEAIVALLGQIANVPSGTYNMTSETRISWRDITSIMIESQFFDLSWENRRIGAVGDPEDVTVSGEKMALFYKPYRSVTDGIRECLASLGWP